MEETRRKYLIDMLEILLDDEFVASELVYLNEDELTDMIINTAFYYKDQAENQHMIIIVIYTIVVLIWTIVEIINDRKRKNLTLSRKVRK